MFGYGVDEIVKLVKKVIVKLLSWIWDKVKGWLWDHWKESTIVILILAVIGLAKILLQGLAVRVFSTF